MNPMKRFLLSALAGLAIAYHPAHMPVAHAQSAGALTQRQGIAATVNDDVISSNDLRDRITLTIVSAALPNTSETYDKLRLQVLRSMIDERLQSQEGQRLGVNIAQQDIDAAMNELAVQNKIAPGQFIETLKASGVPIRALEDQVRAQLYWRGVIERRLRRQVTITEQDIDDRLTRMLASAGRPEYQVSEIFLSVEDAAADTRVQNFAQKLVDQMRGGQSFAAIARQFSEGAGAANGGVLGWIQPGDLPRELNDVLVQMSPGTISAPIRSPNGYHILAVQNVRQIAANANASQIDLRQLGIDAKEGESDDDLLQRAITTRKDLKNCADMDTAIKESASSYSAALGKLALKDINPQLQNTVTRLKAGETSQPMKMGNAAIILMVCGKTLASDGLPPRNDIGTMILRERLDMLQRRYLRDLRSAAYIDIRS